MADPKKLSPELAEMVRKAMRALAADEQGELESWLAAISEDLSNIEYLIQSLPKEAYEQAGETDG